MTHLKIEAIYSLEFVLGGTALLVFGCEHRHLEHRIVLPQGLQVEQLTRKERHGFFTSTRRAAVAPALTPTLSQGLCSQSQCGPETGAVPVTDLKFHSPSINQVLHVTLEVRTS